MLDPALRQMLCDPLLMAAGGIDRKPRLFNERTKSIDVRIMGAVLQSFAILTWVGVFHSGLKTASDHKGQKGFGHRMKASASIRNQGAEVTREVTCSLNISAESLASHENSMQTKVPGPTW